MLHVATAVDLRRCLPSQACCRPSSATRVPSRHMRPPSLRSSLTLGCAARRSRGEVSNLLREHTGRGGYSRQGVGLCLPLVVCEREVWRRDSSGQPLWGDAGGAGWRRVGGTTVPAQVARDHVVRMPPDLESLLPSPPHPSTFPWSSLSLSCSVYCLRATAHVVSPCANPFHGGRMTHMHTESHHSQTNSLEQRPAPWFSLESEPLLPKHSWFRFSGLDSLCRFFVPMVAGNLVISGEELRTASISGWRPAEGERGKGRGRGTDIRGTQYRGSPSDRCKEFGPRRVP